MEDFKRGIHFHTENLGLNIKSEVKILMDAFIKKNK